LPVTQATARPAGLAYHHRMKTAFRPLPIRRPLLALLAALALGGSAVAQSQTDAYPSKPITIVVGYPPGGSTDLTGRVLAAALGKSLNATVVVENVGGAGGAIGAQKVLSAAPDGYTLLMATVSTHAIGPLLSKLPYAILNKARLSYIYDFN